MLSILVHRRAVRAAAIILAAAAIVACDSDQFPSGQTADEAVDEPLPLGDPGKGDILVLGGGVTGKKTYETTKTGDVEYFDAKKMKFAKSGKLVTNRIAEPASVIGDGALEDQVLLSGGMSGKAVLKGRNLTLNTKALNTSEAFDPDKEKATKLGGSVTARVGQSATPLPDGRVVIIGGFNTDGTPLNTVEIYNPATKTIAAAQNAIFARAQHTATLLPDGTILLAGGISSTNGGTTNSVEIYKPGSGTVSIPPRMSDALAGHTATLISGCGCSADGKVLIAGGFFGVAFGESATETTSNVMLLYNPATRTFVALPKMTDERALHAAALLDDGKVLLTGGLYGQAGYGAKRFFGIIGGVQDSAEIYDPVKNEVACVGGKDGKRCKGAMQNSRAAHGAVALSNGKVLIVGGVGGKSRTTSGEGAPLKTAEVFDPKKEKFIAAGSMGVARVFPALAAVP